MLDGSETFSVMEGEYDGYPMVAMISSEVQHRKDKSSTPWFLSFSTPLSDSTPKGLPTTKEADDLNRWEDIIDREMSSLCKFVFIGRVTWKGNRELLYYIERPEHVVQEIQKLINGGTMRPFAFRCEQDAEWTNVKIYMQ